MSVAAGLALALASAFALNWGWLAQHGAARTLAPLSPRRPVRSLRLLFADRDWTIGFLVGLCGWVFYVAALRIAPLGLVQATAAGGVGVLAVLAHRRGDVLARLDWSAVSLAIVGLVLVGVSLAGGVSAGRAPHPAALAAWLVASAVVAVPSARRYPGVAAGTLYAAGDITTKTAVHGGAWLAVVPIVLAAHGGAFVALQIGFQRAGALATAGTASLLTNAIPIVAAVVLLHERMPGGALGATRIAGFACVVAAAAGLARRQDSALEALA